MTVTVTVVRVELTGAVLDEMKLRARGDAIGGVVADLLRTTLPALKTMKESPLAKGSNARISIHPEQPIGLGALRRKAATKPPPARFTQPVQLAIPADLWRDIDRERERLKLSVDDLVAWAWRQR